MPKKKTFALRINPEVMEAVEKWAADEFRSTNGQLEWIISKALKEAGRYPKKPKGA
ncbi:MAG: DNA-binding protein [Bacteroidales bacterium]|nr:DNA-binding protein [Bacteroidales bacterium]MCF8343748.1 DNA-binding protein [Bacteroidales bacterium]MCF8352769.1 DNA-binding protein [Bacteroidales bacterium]MCF8377874.1 DNA-binding protein [Bacteroidales bacterium]